MCQCHWGQKFRCVCSLSWQRHYFRGICCCSWWVCFCGRAFLIKTAGITSIPHSLQATKLTWGYFSSISPQIFSRFDSFSCCCGRKAEPCRQPRLPVTQIDSAPTPTLGDKMSCFWVNHCAFLLLNRLSNLRVCLWVCLYVCSCTGWILRTKRIILLAKWGHFWELKFRGWGNYWV